MRQPKLYSKDGYAGRVAYRKNRITGLHVGLYHGVQSTLEGDPETPWIVVCEEHGCCLATSSLALGKAHMSVPDWCEDCRPIIEAKRKS